MSNQTPDPSERTWVVCVRSQTGTEECVARDPYGLPRAVAEALADRMTMAEANTLVTTLRTFVPQSLGTTFWYRFQPK